MRAHGGEVTCERRPLYADGRVAVYAWKEVRAPKYEWRVGGSCPRAVDAVNGPLQME